MAAAPACPFIISSGTMQDDIDFAAHMETVALALRGPPSSKHGNEWRYGTNGSLSIDIKRGTFFDHEHGIGGGTLALIQHEKPGADAVDYLAGLGCIKKPRPGNGANNDPFKGVILKNNSKQFHIVKTWTYVDETSAELFEVCRLENGETGADRKPRKEYRQRRKENGEYINNVKGIRQIPYRLPELIEAIAINKLIFIVEGEKCTDAIIALGGAATCNAMGAGKWPDELAPFFKGAAVVILPDNDEPGTKHAALVAEKLAGVAKRVRILELPDLPPKGDSTDWIEAGGTLAQLYELAEKNSSDSINVTTKATAKFIPAYKASLVKYNGVELLEKEFPPRETILSPWLPEQGLALIFSERGVGKTWIAMNVGYAVSGGGSFLGWQAQRPRRVVYIDGEMPAGVVKERFSRIVTAADFDAPEDNLQFVIADAQPDGLPDLADPSSQQYYDDCIRDAELIILDNLSTLCRSLKENEADSYGPVQEWSLRQRAAGRSVISVHHANKAGSQRGSNKKEDVLDTVVELRRPPAYDPSQGARLEIHYTKSRGFAGEGAKPFEAWLKDGQWERCDINTNCDAEAVHAFHEEGMSIRDIADRLRIPKSTVAFKLKAAK